uniref:Uncharacterized protein n=1 Tax=Rhizophora mucronata TaxID=61149 RepID=A0A2P2QRS1_RHIMU
MRPRTKCHTNNQKSSI